MSYGRPRRHYRSTNSTNARARALATAGAAGGTVVTAAEQTAGRGRQGRTWTAPAGKALLCSAIVRPLGSDLLPLAAPLAVCEAIESVTPLKCVIKWPNDVWVEGRKVAGLLIEARPDEEWAVIGAGINVAISPEEFPAELRESAASIDHGVGVEDALAALCEGLDKWIGDDAEAILSAYRERDALRGRKIAWGDEKGTADGIADDGNLLVVREDGERLALGAGEVHLSLS